MVIMDYRTVHRGTLNKSGQHRPVIMLIYGREWWSDVVNYGTGDYGGYALKSNWDKTTGGGGKYSVEERLENMVKQIKKAEEGAVWELTRQQKDKENNKKEEIISAQRRHDFFTFLARLWGQHLMKNLDQ